MSTPRFSVSVSAATVLATSRHGHGGIEEFDLSVTLPTVETRDGFDILLRDMGEAGYTYGGEHPRRRDTFIFQKVEVVLTSEDVED